MLEAFGPERLDLKTGSPQSFGCSSDCRARFGSNWGAAVVLEISDADTFQLILAGPTHRHRRSRGIAVVGTLHDLKQNSKVVHVSGHGSHHTQQCEWTDGDREVSRRRYSAGRGLQS